jgi:hypothetical protein
MRMLVMPFVPWTVTIWMASDLWLSKLVTIATTDEEEVVMEEDGIATTTEEAEDEIADQALVFVAVLFVVAAKTVCSSKAWRCEQAGSS